MLFLNMSFVLIVFFDTSWSFKVRGAHIQHLTCQKDRDVALVKIWTSFLAKLLQPVIQDL